MKKKVQDEQQDDVPSLLDIDQDSLDEEWMGQSKLYYSHAAQLAEARFQWAEAKTELEVLEAELGSKVREDPGEFGLDKITEKGVESAVLQTREYQKAVTKVNRKKYEVDVLEAAVTALEHRKRALEGLVTLYGLNYWSEPRVKGLAKEEFDDLKKKTVRRRGK